MREGELEEENSAKESRKQRDNWAVQHKVMVAKGPVSMCVSACVCVCAVKVSLSLRELQLISKYGTCSIIYFPVCVETLSSPLHCVCLYERVMGLRWDYSCLLLQTRLVLSGRAFDQ